jgi:ubiquinone/menaquinone biosynthesis C-methylase UbiE
MKDQYTLGTTAEEQERLEAQRHLYGDTLALKFPAQSRVLELGCGPGVNLWIARQLEGGHYVGVDNELSQIEKARAAAKDHGVSNATFIHSPANMTDLEGKSFDIVFIRLMLVHLSDPHPILQEARRLTRMNGQIIVIEPDDMSLAARPKKSNLVRAWRAKTKLTRDTRQTHAGNPTNIAGALERAGFVSVKMEPHVVRGEGSDAQRCSALLSNWMAMIERVADDLIKGGYIDKKTLDKARAESKSVDAKTVATMTMWIARAIRH